jgi:hypothetical protein
LGKNDADGQIREVVIFEIQEDAAFVTIVPGKVGAALRSIKQEQCGEIIQEKVL